MEKVTLDQARREERPLNRLFFCSCSHVDGIDCIRRKTSSSSLLLCLCQRVPYEKLRVNLYGVNDGDDWMSLL